MDDEPDSEDLQLECRQLPDRRYELRLGFCIPVILSAETFSRKTETQLFVLLAELTMNTYDLAEKYGYDFPLQTGKFIQKESGREVYTLEEEA